MSAPKKIAILAKFPIFLVNEKYPTDKGHYATWLPSLCDAFEHQNNFEIHWITLYPNLKKADEFNAKNQFFHVLPRTKKTIGLYSLYLYERRLIKQCIKRIKPDLVHAWGNEDCYGLAGGDFAGSKLLTIQGLLTRCVKLSPMNRFSRHQSLYEPYSIQRYANVTAESPSAVANAQAISPKSHIQQFDYAVELPFFALERNLSAKPYFLFAGTNTPGKNVKLLIAAFSSPQLAHIELKLAGIQPEDHFPPNVHALGRVPRQKMAELMSETWGLLTPSLTETGPTVVKEARVMGIPCIVSDECGSKQYVTEGKSGFIINSQDIESMIQHILTLSKSEEINLSMGTFEQDKCRHKLSKEHMLERINDIYHQLF